MKNKITKVGFIILSILFIIPSVIYLIQNKTVYGFSTYYNFFINENADKMISTILYLMILLLLFVLYLIIIKRKDMFKDIKQILGFVAIIGVIFLIMLPWTTSDIFYYMGVGELDGIYHQNPYYVTIGEYCEQNKENINDEILEQGNINVWRETTVVYGPIAQLIFRTCSSVSFKNINICLLIFKIVNLIIHIFNCYIIYKISGKKKFVVIYGLNPFILLEFIGNVHNDIILVCFVLLTIYFLLKKKNILLSIIFLALATGIKYFTILLLPVVIIYHFREEKRIGIRFLRCFQYGLLFLLIFGLEYILYFENLQVLIAMLVQTTRYSKSIYSALIIRNADINDIVRVVLLFAFFIYYVKFCIDLITTKEIKWMQTIRKYNIAVILSLLILTTFQQWYLVWLFATIMWQKPNMIYDIIGISMISEIANSVYMFKKEWYIYDIYFVGCITCLFIIWQVYRPILKKCNGGK